MGPIGWKSGSHSLLPGCPGGGSGLGATVVNVGAVRASIVTLSIILDDVAGEGDEPGPFDEHTSHQHNSVAEHDDIEV